ncbi:MAG: lipopolysaccharide biosynthesis protein [Oscillospiraceae bacterium]|nr:lipopolysaccharide biosynthesis protein [Oscillospiraceae bacterium]
MSEQNVNLILKQHEKNEEQVVVSISAIIRKLKKYFAVWLLVAIIIGGLIAGVSVFFRTTSMTPVHAIVSFTHKGIEKGKNPDGTDFDYNTLKSPEIIEAALKECNLDKSLLEAVRRGMQIEGIIPEDAYQRMSTYKHVYEASSSGQLAAATAMLDVSWVSTQYNLTFNYKESGLTRSDAVQVLNAMLAAYRDYYFREFGYNEAFGNSLAAMDYTDYDYAQAVDMFRTELKSLNRYVTGIAADDTARFRSSETGYTFADLKDAINSVQTLDLDLISSYLNVNNVSKDKERLQTYYEWRIENLELEQKADKEALAAVEHAFSSYEKDQVIIFSDSVANTETTVSSEEYDKLINRRIDAQEKLTETNQNIEYYKQRLATLKKTSTSGTAKAERIEKDLAKLKTKIDNLIDLVNGTADDYYRNVALSDSYNILVPATSAVATTVQSGIKKAVVPIFGIEAVLLMVYLAVSFGQALVEETRKRNNKLAAEKAGAAGAETVEKSDEKPEKSDKKKS